MIARGIRNNNPGNIDYNPKVTWEGQEGIEAGVPKPRFIRFRSPEYGIRAIGKIIQTYSRKHKLNTLAGIASRYAPPNENNTVMYARSLSAWSGIPQDVVINTQSVAQMTAVVAAIIRIENGENPYPDSVIAAAMRMICKEP